MKILFFILSFILIVSVITGCSLGMKPNKTSVKVSNTMSSIDKSNSDSDQTKSALTVSITQDFKWDSK
tara:strand:- start:699 stop:902 length:204 start_codon:yes stop_codon:yes gene_type:complete